MAQPPSQPKPDFARAFWRLIETPPASGAWNMAVDETLLETVASGASLPVLRLYRWDPPCLSLGYAQMSAEVDTQRLAAFGWDLVRRPTGGRAILHTDELTYSVTAPLTEPRVAGSVLESYQRLSQALLLALTSLGLPVQTQALDPTSTPGKPLNPVCFDVPSTYEITVGGKKLIGSAQARRKNGVLQHGSLPLTGDLSRIVQALVYPLEEDRQAAADRLLQRATTVASVFGREIAWEAAASAFASAFSQALNLEWVLSELTPVESARADELVHTTYAQPAWTAHR